MKPILPLLFLFACTKQVDRCPELLFIATTYEGGRVVAEYTTNFGQVCGSELEYYRKVAGRVELICPPEQYGKWILK